MLMLPQRLRALRKAKGLTQQQIAEKLAIGAKAYGHYESGRSQPNMETLIAMADLLEVTTDYLLGRTE